MYRSTHIIGAAYFQTWRDRDFESFAQLLAENVHFIGSMGEVQGRDACVESIRHLRELLQDIRVIRQIADGGDVITWFELDIEGISPVPVANWSHVENGYITEIRVTFDPRSMLANIAG